MRTSTLVTAGIFEMDNHSVALWKADLCPVAGMASSTFNVKPHSEGLKSTSLTLL